MKSLIANEEIQLRKILERVPFLKSEIDRHKILFELCDFGLQCLVESVKAANNKDYDRAASFDQFSHKVIEARKAASNFEINTSSSIRSRAQTKPSSDLAKK